jgi:CHASE2 domain-containing sensor protein
MARKKPKHSQRPSRVRLKLFQYLSTLRGFWLSRSRFTQAIIVGVIIEAVLHIGPPTVLRQQLENAAMDWTIRMFGSSDVLSASQKNSALAFTFLNIDEPTYQEKWGNKFFTPRDKLLALIKFAASHESRVVIVDIDLSRSVAQGGDPVQGEAELAAYLESYPPQKDANYNWPPIILVRRFAPSLASDGGEEAQLCRSVRSSYLEGPGKNTASILEGDIAPLEDSSGVALRTSPLVLWASAEFVQEDDLMVRYWRLWEQGCDRGHTTLVPSVELLTSALAAKPSAAPEEAAPGLLQLNCWLANIASPQCNECPLSSDQRTEALRRFCPSGLPQPVQFGHLSLDTNSQAQTKDISQRIIYGIPWKLPPSTDWPSVQLPGHVVAPLLRIVSAGAISDPDGPLTPDLERQWGDQWFRQRVVVIGGSYSDSGDLHGTPIGTLPGAMILINAIHSAYVYGIVHSSWKIEYSILIVMLLAVSWCFSRWHPLIALVVTGLVGFVLMIFASLLFLQRGGWFDFIIPVGVIGIHHVVVQSEDALGLHKHAPGASHNLPQESMQKASGKDGSK